MKKMNKLFSLMALAAAFVLTGCIDETFPESETATQEQVSASPTAFEASLRGIPAKMVEGYLVYGEQEHETDMAYPQFMLAQTEMMGDIYPGGEPGYDWYQSYNVLSRDFSENTYFAYLPWFNHHHNYRPLDLPPCLLLYPLCGSHQNAVEVQQDFYPH